MAGLTRFDPANYVLFASSHDGRVDGEYWRETPARERDDGALASPRIRVLQWRSGLVAISVESRVLTA